MRLLVTGARGKVGRRVVAAAQAAGHRVTATDIGAPDYGPAADAGAAPYLRADLTDYGQAIAIVHKARPDVVVHAAGLPDPAHDPAHVVFATNASATFNVAEAMARSGIGRLVYLSSETVPGFVTAERPFVPDYLPVDEEHPVRPQDGYALSKFVGEQICEALVRRSDATAVSVRPSLVVSTEMYPTFVSRLQQAPVRPFPNQWSYVDADDLAGLVVLAAAADTPGHEVVYAAQPDNLLGRPLADLLKQAYGDTAPPLRDLPRPDAGGIAIDKARRVFGWNPKRSWRDHLSD
ncbi:NAD-dependent epimerase/dehydratase family protein [Pseudonocardia kunmingensis]|uniref:Nucleoside-diphosphate-sugar epimerase n=1 Tax=Pseudonocardia kunmingensis TaxID=630975 RepID=A0A543DPN7_9PSEU|nr:NAD(P)-dependent oxidoreductase [Pseudonocardia kunmingensis]TQM11296.1 nucleoside-diphosphate-sugar epimerase [Pseudonocardia kunmingensis]